MDVEQYDAIMAELKLIGKIIGAEQRISQCEDYISLAELKSKFGKCFS